MRAERFVNILIVLFVIVAIAAGIYISFFVPCKNIKWLTLRDLPARCLELRP